MRIDAPHVPPLKASFGRRAIISTLRALPLGQDLALRAYRKVARHLWCVTFGLTYFGGTMECDLSDFIPECIYHFGVWEPHISAAIQGLLHKGETFCDVGANIGYHSLLASSLVGTEGHVIAVEPSPAIVARLQKNLGLNSSSNVRVVPAAAHSERGTISIYQVSKFNTGMTTTIASQGAAKVCDVTCLPLSEILTDEERSRLGIIKIDVEGAEPAILREILDHLDIYPQHFHIVVEMSETPENIDLFERFLQSGFTASAIQNSYDLVRGYLELRSISAPLPMSAPPTSKQDVLFSR